MASYLVAVDVGTRSARAGVFDTDGHMLARAVAPLGVTDMPGQRAEYASDQIWDAVCSAVQAAVAGSGVDPGSIAGLGFDATCSLVLRSEDGSALDLGQGRDTIAWYDHRAEAQARACTATGHRLIGHLGGAMSPEMQTPKLMWLKQHRPALWSRLGEARDLADHLTARATGSRAASGCALAAKWPFLPDHGGWQHDFLAAVGLEDLLARAGLPEVAAPVDRPVGRLSEDAAERLGLRSGLPVAAGMIDAYAGALGTVGLRPEAAPDQCLTLIAGTSNCIMAITRRPLFARGIWGPSRDTVLPGFWTSEGGQSAAGAALEYVLDLWPATGLSARPGHEAVLARIADALEEQGTSFGADLDVLPDFNGNRSPLSDASARGVVSGLTLDRSVEGLCALYWRTAVSLALGVRQIMELLNPNGSGADSLAIAGGLARTPILKQLFADVTGLKVLRSRADDVVLLGTAIAAATAAGLHPDLLGAARAMSRLEKVIEPDAARHAGYDRDYRVMLRMQAHRDELAALKR
ncbi:MAG: FGGY family pentulose kinase [Rhodobacteraceae bacterium]|nr:FGGY family pentulose kinase [Paracoccaceae bacterium]